MELGSYLVSVHSIDGLRIVATWSGGAYIEATVPDIAGDRPVFAWSVWSTMGDEPRLPRELSAFRQFVADRLADRSVRETLRRLAEDDLGIAADESLEDSGLVLS